MTRAIALFWHAAEGAMVVLLAAMVAMVFGNVVLRYAFNSGIIVSEELSRWCFLWITFVGAVVALRDRAHLGSDFLVGRLPPAGKRACLVLGHALMLYATWLVFSGALAQVRINLDVQAPVTGASMAWVYGTGVVFAVLAAPLLVRDLWRALSGRLADEELVMIRGSEEERP